MMCFGRGFPWAGMVLAAACVVAVVIVAALAGWWAFPLLCLVMMVVMMAGMSRHSGGRTTGERAANPLGALCGWWWRESEPNDPARSPDQENVES